MVMGQNTLKVEENLKIIDKLIKSSRGKTLSKNKKNTSFNSNQSKIGIHTPSNWENNLTS